MKWFVLPPAPLTRWQRRAVLITTLAVAATRLYALAPTLWDWDEAQFASGVREYDVARHHPHPPGFPLFILAAKIVRPLAGSDFGACQAVVLLAALALFPLAFALARELRFSFVTSFLASLLFVFFPNVWFYGGTGFSDIPGAATALAAAMLLLRGCRSPRAFLAGAVVLGISAGIRSQALLFGCAPFAVAAWIQLRQSWRRALAAGVIVAAIGAASYGGAALATSSLEGYRNALAGVRDWVRTIDSYLAPGRPPLSTLVDEYFLRPMGGNRLPIVVAALCAIALVASMIRPRAGVWMALAIFAPFAVFAWLMLDYNSIHRYSTSYVFVYALLAAHGAAAASLPLRRWSEGAQVAAQAAMIALVAGRAAYWTIPALREVRDGASPTYAAMQWLRQHVPAGRPVWVEGGLRPHADYFLYDREVRYVTHLTQLPRVGVGRHDYFATEGLQPHAVSSFVRGRQRLWEIARHRYFETSIAPVANLWAFGAGWHELESDGRTIWRWMGRRSVSYLPAVDVKARLTMSLSAAGGISPLVEVRMNGRLLDSFRPGFEPVTREWVVDSRGDAPNELELISSEVTRAPGDPRDLSLLLHAYGWQPLP